MQITLGNLISVLVLLVAFVVAFSDLKTNIGAITQQFHDHQAYDDKRFAEVSTKETREMRDRWVDQQFADIKDQLKEIAAKLPTKK